MTQQPDHDPQPGVHDLGYARLDTDRLRRTGDPEVVYGAGKTPTQVVELLRTLHAAHPNHAVLATRLSVEAQAAVAAELPDAVVDEVGRTAVLGEPPVARGTVAVVAAGTSDAPVAAEAATTARVFGADVERITDVGVAGLHRIMGVRDRLDAADCLIVVAGMEGALPSVVGGLVGVPLVAVPTSVGYGASFGGVAALLGMLNSCAPGVTVVNIDNGFGAGVFAARVARRAAPATGSGAGSPVGSSAGTAAGSSARTAAGSGAGTAAGSGAGTAAGSGAAGGSADAASGAGQAGERVER